MSEPNYKIGEVYYYFGLPVFLPNNIVFLKVVSIDTYNIVIFNLPASSKSYMGNMLIYPTHIAPRLAKVLYF